MIDDAADASAETRQLLERVHRAPAGLPAEDREIPLIRSCDKLSYGEIATLLDVPPPAARQRYGRALVRVSRLLSAAALGAPDV